MRNGMFVNESGEEAWYKDDKIHREDGPAIIWSDGDAFWCKNGLLHREDGPAVGRGNVKKWYIEGKVHRLDGPAILYKDGREEWWLNDKKLTKEEWWNSISDEMKLKVLFSERGQLED